MSLIIFLIVGGVAGWLAGQIMRGGGFGILGNVVIGILGAVVAGFLLPGLLAIDGILGGLVSATIGAVILLFVIGLFQR